MTADAQICTQTFALRRSSDDVSAITLHFSFNLYSGSQVFRASTDSSWSRRFVAHSLLLLKYKLHNTS